MNRWKLSVICLILSVIGCGMPTAAMVYPEIVSAPVPVHKDTYIDTEVSITVNMVACRVDAELGGLRVRPAPGDLSTYSKVLASGESVTVRKPATITDDMGMWYELVDGGWVNARYLCEEK